MTEIPYLKIISDLFRLIGYAEGALEGINYLSSANRNEELNRNLLDELILESKEHIDSKVELILMRLEKEE